MRLSRVFAGIAAAASALTLMPPGAHAAGDIPPAPAAAAASAIDWPQFRFNDARIGVNPFERVLNVQNVPSMAVQWQAQLGALVDYSSPAVVGGVAYIGSTDGRLYNISYKDLDATLALAEYFCAASM